MKIEELSTQHQSLWTTLQLLDDGERILGVDLQNRTTIKDRRSLYHVVKDLREHTFLVGSSKQTGSSGYFEIRDEQDLNLTLRSMRESANSLLDTAKHIEIAFYKQQIEKEDNKND